MNFNPYDERVNLFGRSVAAMLIYSQPAAVRLCSSPLVSCHTFTILEVNRHLVLAVNTVLVVKCPSRLLLPKDAWGMHLPLQHYIVPYSAPLLI